MRALPDPLPRHWVDAAILGALSRVWHSERSPTRRQETSALT